MEIIAGVGEEELIARLRRRLGLLSPAPPDGIGDDAARWRVPRGGTILWSTDLLQEGVHFRRAWASPRLLGRKALAVNASDLAAMGARPRTFLLGLSLPGSLPLAWFDDFVRGLAQQARAARLLCAGGDTCAAGPGSGVGISVSMAGTATTRRLLTRDAARPGDGLWVSGPLGASAMGLRLLERGWRLRGRSAVRRGGVRPDQRRMASRALRAHLDPRPPLELGPWLLRQRISRAALDLSDGLSTDLDRLCRASGVGALIDPEAVPVDRAVTFWEGKEQALAMALHGGEDYALLFAVPAARSAGLDSPPGWPGVRPVRVGEVIRGRGVRLQGSPGLLQPGGYRHFPGRRRGRQ